MTTTPPEGAEVPADRMPSQPWSMFRLTGLLWAVNREVLHPRGYALALDYETPDGSGEPTGWHLEGDGTEPWQFGTDADSRARELAGKMNFEALLSMIAMAFPPADDLHPHYRLDDDGHLVEVPKQ